MMGVHKPQLDNRWGSLVSSMFFSMFNIHPAIDAQSGASSASA